MSEYADRVRDTTTTTGTGAITLSGTAPDRFRTFAAAFPVGSRVRYLIEGIAGSGEWEVGRGTLSASTTLTRDEVYASSNSNALVNFSAGTKAVACTWDGFMANDVDTHGRLYARVMGATPL